jgi:hypothetical protein
MIFTDHNACLQDSDSRFPTFCLKRKSVAAVKPKQQLSWNEGQKKT